MKPIDLVGGSSSRFSSANSSEMTVNPVLTQEYLDVHDAVLLCGPFKLNQFIDASGQIAILTLSSHELIQSTSRNFLIHMKYIPSVTQVSHSFIHSKFIALLSSSPELRGLIL